MCSRLWLKFIFDAARAHPTLVPLAVYDRAACGYSQPVPMTGFVMYEIDGGVGSILRVMIDRAHQRKGYGRAALLEVVRRDTAVAAALFRSLGLIPWELDDSVRKPGEVYLRPPNGERR